MPEAAIVLQAAEPILNEVAALIAQYNSGKLPASQVTMLFAQMAAVSVAARKAWEAAPGPAAPAG